MFDFSIFSRNFPREWETIEKRSRQNSGEHIPVAKLVISGIGRAPRPKRAHVDVLFKILLETFMEVSDLDEYESDFAKLEFHRARYLYQQEVIGLIGSWSDEALRAVSEMGKGDSSRRFKYLDGLRRSTLTFYY